MQEELDEETEIQINKIKNPKKAPEPFPVRMFPCKRYFSDDSSSDYSSSSDSECETIVSVDELVKVIVAIFLKCRRVELVEV